MAWRRFAVCERREESETIASFRLRPVDGPLAPFLPGQFLTVRAPLDGAPVRTYSLCGGPGEDSYRLGIKREGLVSSWFHDEVRAGTVLEALPPRGRFVCEPDDPAPHVLLGAGVGQTPLLAMLHARAAAGRPTWWFHGARNGREHAFAAEVRALASPAVAVHVCYSRPGEDDRYGEDYDSAERVSIILLNRLLRDEAIRARGQFYLCGPVPFLRQLHEGLLAWGAAEERVHYELFGPAEPLRAPDRPRTARHPGVARGTVRFARSGREADWDPACDNLLDFAQGLGLRPPYSCRAGSCHVCQCPLLEGEVEPVQELLHPPDPGTVLICSSRPRGDIVLDL